MPIQVVCSQCGKKLSAPDRIAGKQAKCPQCGTRLNVPAMDDVVEAEAVPEDPVPFGGGVEQFGFPQTAPAAFQGTPNYAQPPMGGLGSPKSYDLKTRMLLPVGRSSLAIAAGWAGIFSFLCVFPAPVAVLLGILAIRDLRLHPEKHGMGRAIFGIVMGVIFCVPILWLIWKLSNDFAAASVAE
jgi:hypothetical protein